ATAVGTGQGQPADVGLVAVLLRPDVRRPLLVDGRVVHPDLRGTLAVPVVLLGTAPVEADRVQLRRDPQDRADLGDVGQRGRTRVQRVVHFDLRVAEDRVGGGVGRFGGRRQRALDGDDDGPVVGGVDRHLRHRTFLPGVAPGAVAVRLAVA